jgi:cellobiose phosphorylase
MKEYHVQRVLRDADFDITVKNPEGRQSGVRQVVLDGSPIEGNIIKATPGHHTIEVIM